MKPGYICSAIIWEPDQNLLLFDNIEEEYYAFPQVKVHATDNGMELLKSEVEHDYQIKVKFLKMLPDTWAQLVFVYSKHNEIFRIYYVYKLIDIIKQQPSRQDEFGWVEIADLSENVLGDKDFAALEVFKETFEIE